ncbi:tRNA pseudouridine synthase B [Geodia barretti]|uniref:tRNA pseudouridine(55) synthase n=3 Tax=Geodia barretti TaxID=519541 RepID=A0AA35RJ99_GEOBA|nr:tRNA pseudouridine synthase B [Geodia barretti]
MYSAIKKDGQPLYKLARQGKNVPREPRRVTVKSLTLTEWDPPDFQLRIECGSGFYARSLAHDLGQEPRLRRAYDIAPSRKGREFHIEDSVSIDELTAGANDDSWTRHLLKPDYVLKHFDAICIGSQQTAAFTHGRAIDVAHNSSESGEVQVSVYAKSGELLGLGFHDAATSRLRPAKVFHAAIESSGATQI